VGYIADNVHNASVLKWNLIELGFSPLLRFSTGDVEVIWEELKPALVKAFQKNNLELARTLRNNPSIFRPAGGFK